MVTVSGEDGNRKFGVEYRYKNSAASIFSAIKNFALFSIINRPCS